MNRFIQVLLFLLPLVVFSCKEFDDSPKALVNILLIDAPAKWDSVIVEIQGVELEFVPNGRQGEVERLFLPYEPGDKQVDISQLVGGVSLPVARNEMQLGVITGVTLRIGTENALYLDEDRYPLELPEGNTDYFLPVSIDLDQGLSYDLVLDFDLVKSIQIDTENPLTFDFNPSLSAFSGIGRSNLTGTTSPSDLRPVIYAIQDSDSVSTHTNTGGSFSFRLISGTYDVYIDPKDSRYLADTIRGVLIESGKTTDLERIILNRK